MVKTEALFMNKICWSVCIFLYSLSVHCQINPQHQKNEQEYLLLQTEPKIRKENKLLKATAVPAVLMGLGVYSVLDSRVINRYEIKEVRDEHFPNFHSKIDNYLIHTPAVLVYGLNMAGVKGKNDLRNRTLLLIKSEVIMAVLTFSLKSVSNVQRPDGSDYESFPSGHTAQAFATATFMAKEYGDKSIWYSVGAYGMATTVGAMRILNNRHWASDVFMGAGIGILSTNIAYLTHRYRWKNKNANLTLLPSYSKGPGVYVSYRFR